MKRFDCLDRHLKVHSHTLLEASAGTGKTFSIENLFVRLLIQEPAATVEQILVVTFTNAATKELRARIRQKISASLKILKVGKGENVPDYLLAFLEKSEKEIKLAKRRLEGALCSFDLSNIFTIHAFCEKSLRDNQFVLGKETKVLSELLTTTELLRIIRDFFRTGLSSDDYSPEQIYRVMSLFKQDYSYLEWQLLSILQKGVPIDKRKNFGRLFSEFKEAFREIKEKPWSSRLYSDFEKRAPYYKGIKDEVEEKVLTFCNLFKKKEVQPSDFNTLITDGLPFIELLDPSNQKKKGSPLEDIPYMDELKEKLGACVQEARSPQAILCRMASGCQELLHQALESGEKYRFDDLLLFMLKRSQELDFSERIREQYRAVIIDEFQDTDPVQWDIFDKLFLKDPKRRSYLYLVGDPKQSIYAFRQADIYTYLKAAKEVGEEGLSSLNVNWRSQESMIRALNALFSAPGLISLPKTQSSLSYHPLEPCTHIAPKTFSDQKGSIHFLMASGKKGRSKTWPTKQLQEESLFPAIANEIIRLKQEENIPYSEWAVLVKDKDQAKDFSGYCQSVGIPIKNQKRRSLLESEAFDCMKDLIAVLIDFKDLSALKILLGGPLIGFDKEKIAALEDHEILLDVAQKMSALSELALEKGFGSFYQQFMQSRFLKSHTVKERLLSGQINLYYDFEQIAEILIDYQYQNKASLLQSLSFLQDFETLDKDADERLQARQNPEGEAVSLLTIHMSKGLEFGFVAALGLAKRTSQKDNLILCRDGNGFKLVPSCQKEAFNEHLAEIDAEKMRQFYVAVTRAKYRALIPVASQEEKKEPGVGEASPMELFLKHFGGEEGFIWWIKQNGKEASVSYERLQDPVKPLNAEQEKNEIKIFPPKKLSFSFQKDVVRSFSSLAKPHDMSGVSYPRDFSQEVKSVHTLPSGKEIGTLLHKILENLSFDCDNLPAFASTFIANTPYQEWDGVISSMLEKVLSNPLKDGLRLRDISPEKSFREIEFLYPSEEMFLKGVIDFVFEFQGRYFIIDWKSNWLGDKDEDYSQENLEKCMQNNDYFLQAGIYREAFKRYIALFDSRPFQEIFGGILYVFLRGIENKETKGVYFIK